MILGSLNNTITAERTHPLFKQAFDFIKSANLVEICEGASKIELEGRNLFLTGYSYKGKTKEEAIPEAHRKYIDIQVVVEGTEQMGWTDLSKCSIVSSPYSDEKDLIFFGDRVSSYIKVAPGDFAVFFPEDVHAPGISNENIRKIVIKVLV